MDYSSIMEKVNPPARVVMGRINKAPITEKAVSSVASFGVTTGFKIMMHGLFNLLRFSGAKFPAFKELLMEQDVVMLMRDKDDSARRRFHFNKGKLTSPWGSSFEPDFELIWRTPGVGCKVMAEIGAGKRGALKKAVMRGDLLLAGDAMLVKWFLDVTNMMARLYKGAK